jgi:hypothetical protein
MQHHIPPKEVEDGQRRNNEIPPGIELGLGTELGVGQTVAVGDGRPLWHAGSPRRIDQKDGGIVVTRLQSELRTAFVAQLPEALRVRVVLGVHQDHLLQVRQLATQFLERWHLVTGGDQYPRLAMIHDVLDLAPLKQRIQGVNDCANLHNGIEAGDALQAVR